MQKKYSFEMEYNNIIYEVRISYHLGDARFERGYYMEITPFFIGENNLRRLSHKDRHTSLIQSVKKQSSNLLDKIVFHKESFAIEILREYHEDLVKRGVIKDSGIKTIKMETGTIEKHKEKEIISSSKFKSVSCKQTVKKEKGFSTIAGYEEVKDELLEIVDYIKNPLKYSRMGAKLPKGILLYGPPGTGKTHLTRALAEETDMNFISACGSEFVEKYVGVGAKRVRDLFEKARINGPSIIFIDEIDAIGLRRTGEGTNNEKDQTLNQLLAELDGFKVDSSVILIGATNRMDFLDDALKRPGRLDKHIYVGNPDKKTRKELFNIHTKNKPLSEDVDVEALAGVTHGFSCAEVANVCNQASLIAIRENREDINHSNFENALEVIVGGLKSKSKVLDKDEKNRVAYHEAGHAVANYLLGYNKIQKVSIIPRGESLGCVMKVSSKEKFLKVKSELLSDIKILLAGRASEELIFGDCSTGASNDLERSSGIALNIVAKYGLSNDKSLFALSLDRIPDSLFLEYKSKAEEILSECYADVQNLLKKNSSALHTIAQKLLEKEELTLNDIENIFEKDLPIASYKDEN